MDRIDNLRAFVAVGDLGSFSAAARRLGRSKVLVSRQVAELEAELGTRLLSRTTRAVAFTGPGLAFHPKARGLIEAYDEAAAEVKAGAISPRGPIKVSGPMSYGLRHLTDAVLDFACLHPDVVVHLDLNDRFVDLVEEGFDLGLRIGHLPDSSLLARRLGEVRRVVCAAPAYLEAQGHPQTPADLLNHRCLHYGYTGPVERWRFRGPEGEIVLPLRPAFRSSSGEALLRAGLRGLGIVQQPWFIVGPEIEAGRLVLLLAPYEEAPLPIHLLMPPGRAGASVRALVDFLAARC